MNGFIILGLVMGLVAVVTVLVFFLVPSLSGDDAAARQQMRNMSNQQRGVSDQDLTEEQGVRKKGYKDAEPVSKTSNSSLTLQKKLKYAQWTNIPPYCISIAQVAISLTVFLVVRQYFGMLLQVISLATGPILINTIIMWRVNSRFERFDADYPQFLMSLVGLLKTGMNPVQALQASAEGLGDDSLLKSEITLMLERMKLGVSEDRSIGAFGEDINHPEIELFVQALLLSRRVGGTLSDTLERLAKQVRKRQYFRRAAQAAVALQRGSINMILAILAALELYLFFTWRAAVTDAWLDKTGKSVCEFGLFMIIFGYYWSRQVSKIRT